MMTWGSRDGLGFISAALVGSPADIETVLGQDLTWIATDISAADMTTTEMTTTEITVEVTLLTNASD